MTAYLPWAVEILLECAGAQIYFRRSKLLSAILAFCALSDVALFIVYGRPIYPWASWAQMALKGLLLIWLGCSICGKLVNEKDESKVTYVSAFTSMVTVGLVTSCMFSADTLKNRLLDGEITANLMLAGLIGLSWICRQSAISGPWKWIVIGFLVMIGSDLLFTALWTFWDGARQWYPLGTIAAQLVWVAGPILPYRLKDCRLSLGQKIQEAERVSVC